MKRACLVALSILALMLCVGPTTLAQTSDSAPPALIGFDFSPKTVDASGGPQSVTVTWHVTDDLAGILGGCVTFVSPSGPGAGACFNDPADRISGTDHDGVYRSQLVIPRYAQSGTWTIETFVLTDRASNQLRPTASELAAQGFPTQLVVTGLSDTAPPGLVGFSFSPGTVDVSGGPRSVTVTWHVTDDLAGILGGCVTFVSPSGPGAGACFNDPADRISGTDHDGVYRSQLVIPQYAQSGTWTIESFVLYDRAENQLRPSAADLAAQGFPTQLVVMGESDTTPPALVGFDFSPRVVDISAGPQIVTVVWHVTDNLAGILGGCVTFTSPSGHGAGACFNDPADRISGSNHDGVYQAQLQIPQYSETGTWTIETFVVYDNAENQLRPSVSELSDMGLPTRLLVGPGACDVETSCDDGNVCTDDSCEPSSGCVHTWNGTCVTRPRSAGYYKKLCKHPHSQERLTQTDVDCVAMTCPFAEVASVDDICAVLKKDWPDDDHTCDKAASELMALTLNVCRATIGESQAIDSRCTDHATVGDSLADARAILCNGEPTRDECEQAKCEAKEINSGKALRIDSLRLERLPSGALRLQWEPLYVDPDDPRPLRYRIWRRAGDFEPFTVIGETEDLSFVDAPGSESLHEYEVTPKF